eukprot:TRINITY_DN29423_c0_g1_i1.p1 TRINITY_DN29423_c0_g1~~TRINITY_DN29423_c0_g1_i1.p1  ORF type:complete len:878 (-),score=243.92 TRINITY_DN29423_c0_g1_i1:307-2940(-)
MAPPRRRKKVVRSSVGSLFSTDSDAEASPEAHLMERREKLEAELRQVNRALTDELDRQRREASEDSDDSLTLDIDRAPPDLYIIQSPQLGQGLEGISEDSPSRSLSPEATSPNSSPSVSALASEKMKSSRSSPASYSPGRPSRLAPGGGLPVGAGMPKQQQRLSNVPRVSQLLDPFGKRTTTPGRLSTVSPSPRRSQLHPAEAPRGASPAGQRRSALGQALSPDMARDQRRRSQAARRSQRITPDGGLRASLVQRKSIQRPSALTARDSLAEDPETVSRYADRLERQAHGLVFRSKMDAKAFPIEDPSFTEHELLACAEMMYNGVFGGRKGCMTLIECCSQKSKEYTLGSFKGPATTRAVDKALISMMHGDEKTVSELLSVIKQEFWTAVKKSEDHIYSSSSFLDDKAIAAKYQELKSKCDGYDFEGNFVMHLVEACRLKRQNMIDQRITNMQADMSVMPQLPKSGTVEYRLLVNTMAGIWADETEGELVTSDPTVVSTSRILLDKRQAGPDGHTALHQLVAEQTGKVTLRDPSGKRSIDVIVLTEHTMRVEEERERAAALLQAKKQAKWWGKPPPEEESPDEAEGGGSPGGGANQEQRWKRRKPRKTKERFVHDAATLAKGAWNKRKERLDRKQQLKDNSSMALDFLTRGKLGNMPRMQQWKKHMMRRDSVEEKDLFDLIAPVLFSQTGDSTAKAVELEWAFEALDYAFHIGRSAQTWDAPKTPLRVAVQNGKVELVEALLKNSADPDERYGKWNVSVLHIAAWNGSAEVCQMLLEHDADPDIEESEGQTPIFFAPSVEICQLLFEYGADLYCTNHNGQTALHLACRAANADVIEWLVFNGGYNFTQQRDGYGATPAFYAQQAGLIPNDLLKLGLR